MTVATLLSETIPRLAAAGISPTEAQAEARILASFSLSLTSEALRMYPERPLSEAGVEAMERAVLRRIHREPLAYITGRREFYGLTFRVTPDVLIPRPETEFLVDAVLDFLGETPHGRRVVDVGTGSGCIAVAVASRAPHAEIFATDISVHALDVARINAAENSVAGQIRFAHGDLLAAVAEDGPFDVIVSNPPYISPSMIASLEPEVRDWEPRVALGLDADDLHFYRRLAADGPALLAVGGLLAVEVGAGQADAVQALWTSAGLANVGAIADYAGILRVVIGRVMHHAGGS